MVCAVHEARGVGGSGELGVAPRRDAVGIRLTRVADARDERIRLGTSDESRAQSAAGRVARSEKMKFVEQHGKVSVLGQRSP